MTTHRCVVNMSNMKAQQLVRRRTIITENAFVDIVVWRVPEPVAGCTHHFKYRLALVAENVCVLRYDNEAGKGDHRHIGEREEIYAFIEPAHLLADFYEDVTRWMNEHSHS